MAAGNLLLQRLEGDGAFVNAVAFGFIGARDVAVLTEDAQHHGLRALPLDAGDALFQVLRPQAIRALVAPPVIRAQFHKDDIRMLVQHVGFQAFQSLDEGVAAYAAIDEFVAGEAVSEDIAETTALTAARRQTVAKADDLHHVLQA